MHACLRQISSQGNTDRLKENLIIIRCFGACNTCRKAVRHWTIIQDSGGVFFRDRPSFIACSDTTMSTPSSFPCILSGDDDWHKVSQEISFLTTVLKHCRAGKVQSVPSNSELQFFQHISTLVTTGRHGPVVNAVNGHVGADKIVSIVFTRNAGVTHVQLDDGTCAKTRITPSIPRGKALLETWKLKYTSNATIIHWPNCQVPEYPPLLPDIYRTLSIR